MYGIGPRSVATPTRRTPSRQIGFFCALLLQSVFAGSGEYVQGVSLKYPSRPSAVLTPGIFYFRDAKQNTRRSV
jgi:hypothetical protein